jgi:hypothetical protein
MSNRFTIDPEFLCSITTTTEYWHLENQENPTAQDMIRLLKRTHKTVVTGSHDHPEFAKLRDQLEQSGYIKTERSWCNGDQVLKQFWLNGVAFKKNQQFGCAAALGVQFSFKKNK